MLEDLELFLAVAVVVIGVLVYLLRKKTPNASPPNNRQSSSSSLGRTPSSNAAVDSKKPRMSVMFGSQSGTAETFAQDLAEEAKNYGFNARSVDLETYDAEEELPKEQYAVFLMATFGEGEPTDNATQFCEWVHSSDREQGILARVPFAVFALGNRQYEHFCNVGRDLDRRLAELGGVRVCEHGEGDDDASMDDDYAAWKTEFWAKTREYFKLSTEGGPVLNLFKPSFEATYFEPKPRQPKRKGSGADDEDKEGAALAAAAAGGDKKEHDESDAAGSASSAYPNIPRQPDAKYSTEPPPRYTFGIEGFRADPKHKAELVRVLLNKELRQDVSDNGSTRHIELDLHDTKVSYVTADNLGVFPRNDYKIVARVIRCLGIHPETIFTLKQRPGVSGDKVRKLTVTSPCSVRDALLWYCDITSIPRHKLLQTLSQYATDPKQKATLLAYTSERKEEFHEDRKSLFEVLEEFDSLRIPFVDFIEFIPKLQPRFYTIASSSKKHSRCVHITVSVTRDPKPRGRTHFGVCSNYLASLRPQQDRVCVFVRTSTFRLPRNLNTPVIMVGPGTGLAPFRAFLQEGFALKEKGLTFGKWLLFFGCRHRDKDFIYREEVELAGNGLLHELSLAFSRETEQKVYVQHRLEERAAHVWDLIHKENAYFFVCGGTAMGREVRQALASLAEKFGGMTPAKAADYVKKLQNSNRFIQELWS